LSVSSILYNYISNQKVLTNIAPFIQGVIISLMTAVGLVSAGVVNILLRHSYDYNTLLLMCGFIIIIFGIFTLRFKVLSSQHNRKSSARVSSVKKNVNQSELNENEGAEGPLLLDGQVRGS
jgi:apolipoprotein N-acyltransferase